ncbi:MAG: hypothetical protein ACXABO_11650 [Promethearchaeota archaeon]|jgi:hypothetical protein
MIGQEEDFPEHDLEHFDKVRDALYGLFHILNIALDPKSVYYQCGLDNLEALKVSLIDLVLEGYNPLELEEKLHKIKFNLKSSLHFENLKKKKQKEKQDKESTA